MLGERVSGDVYAAVYDLLARVFLYGPSSDSCAEFLGCSGFYFSLESINSTWPVSVKALLERSQAKRTSVRKAYLECLVIPVKGCYVSPYASTYLDGGVLWGPSTTEVVRCYEAEGLFWNKGWSRGVDGSNAVPIVAPDHLGVELAFLAVISARASARWSSTAREERICSFLQHVTRWLPKLVEALFSCDPTKVLADWTGWTMEVVTADTQRHTMRTS
jgi:TorA maturation chaperone TorD